MLVLRPIFAGFLSLFLACAASAATFVVNSNTAGVDGDYLDCDCDDGTGHCAFWQAVAHADSCPGDDVIQLQAGEWFAGRSNTSSSSIYLDSNIAITGSGQYVSALTGVNPDPSGNSFNLEITNDPVAVSFSHLTLSNINLSVSNESSVNLSSVGVTRNDGTAIYNGGGTIDITLSEIYNNSTDSVALIRNARGTMRIEFSALYNNTSSGCGGVIDNLRDLQIENTAIYGNAGTGGGALCLGRYSATSISSSSITENRALNGDGGAVYLEPDTVSPATLNISNTTVSGNSADGYGGGIWLGQGTTLRLASSTIYDNQANADGIDDGTGGGIFVASSGAATIWNSIVAGNSRRSGVVNLLSDCDGELTSGGYNLVGYNGGCLITAAIGDQIGTLANRIDPLLNPLQSIGSTSVHTLQSGSPAIDGGNIDGCLGANARPLLTDQSGEERTRGFTCDIGASESGYQIGRIVVYPQTGLETSEAGTTAQVAFRTNGAPAGVVTVPLESSDGTEGKVARSLTLPAGSTTVQNVTVFGVDDTDADGDVRYTIITGGSTSTDKYFNRIDPADIELTNLDDEPVCVGTQMTLGPADFLPAPVYLSCSATEWIHIEPGSEIIGNSRVILTAPEVLLPEDFFVEPGSEVQVHNP